MTVPATARRAGPYNGNGSTTSFSFSFKTFANGDLQVTKTSATGIESVLVLDSDYSVTLNPDQDVSPGGSITYPITGTALATGEKLTIVGDLEYEQTTDLLGGGAFNARVIEDTFDRTVIQIQQLEERADRTLTLPVSVSGVSTTLPVPQVSKLIGWDQQAAGLRNYDLDDLQAAILYGDWVYDTFTGDGTTQSFVLQRAPGSFANMDVSISGVTQAPIDDYSISGATLTFTTAPPAASKVLVRYGSTTQQNSLTYSSELKTATASQTVFTLTGTSYAPGATALMVFVNGLLMVAGVDYVETSSTVVTFTSGLTAGDEVLFICGRYLNDAISAETVSYRPAGVGATERSARDKMRESVSVFDFMTSAQIADVQAGTLLLDCAAAFNAALVASKNIYFPPGKYRFNSAITITGARGLTIQGAASAILASGTGYTGTTELVFDNAASGTNGIVITDFVGVTLENMLIRMRRGGVGGGTALYLYNGHDYSLRNIKVDLLVGAGAGIVLGNGSGATSTFVGDIRNCKVMAGANTPGIYANFGTSLTFTACYVIGGHMQFSGMVYSTVTSCAVDASPSYGYIINGCTNMVFDACGAEGCAKGAFYLSTTASNIVLNAPYGAANNTSADPTIGDLVHLDSSMGAVNSITITNPTSVAVNPATAQSIYANAGTGFTEVYNTDLTLLAYGINGHSTWKATKLKVTGFWAPGAEVWTPVLSGWTNVGSPTVTGKYVKQDNLVFFSVTITPGTSISCTRSASSITGLPFAPTAVSATMVDDNVNSYGAVQIGPTGIIYPQTSGVLTVPIYISGTFITI